MSSLVTKAKQVSPWVWIGISGFVLVAIVLIVLWQVGMFSSSSSSDPLDDPFANTVSVFKDPVEQKQTDIHSQIALHREKRGHIVSTTSNDLDKAYRLFGSARSPAVLADLGGNTDVFMYGTCYNNSGDWMAAIAQNRTTRDYVVRFLRTSDVTKNAITVSLDYAPAQAFPVPASFSFDNLNALWLGFRNATTFFLYKFTYDGKTWNRTSEPTQTTFQNLAAFSEKTMLFSAGTVITPYVRIGSTWTLRNTLTALGSQVILTNNGQFAMALTTGAVPVGFWKGTDDIFLPLAPAPAITPGSLATLVMASLPSSPYFAILYIGASPSTNATVSLYRVPSLKTGAVDTGVLGSTTEAFALQKRWTLGSFATSTGTLTMYYSNKYGLDIAGTLQSGAQTTTFVLNATEA